MPTAEHPLLPARRPLAPVGRMVMLGALALALLLAGCGSSSHSAGTSADPAGVTPAGAPLYLGATVRPSGAQATEALDAGRALTHQSDPFLRLLGALRTPGSAALDYEREVAPWLGPHAGLFLRSLDGAGSLLGLIESILTGAASSGTLSFDDGHADGAIVMDTIDASAARSFLATQAHRAGARPSSYRGVSFEATPAGLAFGLIGRFAVIGSEAALRSVIDTTQGASALATASGYTKLAAAAPAEALAHLYLDPAAASPGQRDSGLLAALTGNRQGQVSLLASASSLGLDVDTLAAPGTHGGLLSANPEAAQALQALPGESWLALSLGDLATNLGGDVSELQGVSSLLGAEGGASSLGTLLEGLLEPVAAMGAPTPRARSEFASWMRSGGIFASGAGLLELKAAIVIDSADANRSRAAVAALGAILSGVGDAVSHTSIPGTEAALSTRLRGFPLVLDIAAGRGSDGAPEFILGLGAASVGAALSPPSTLSNSATRATAASALGGTPPSVILQLPTLIGLLEGIGLTESRPLSTYVPYLRALSTVSGGGQQAGGEVERFRIVVGLSQAAG